MTESNPLGVHHMGVSGRPKKGSPNPFEGMNDAEIWDSYRKGNEAAYIHIYSKYVASLYNYGCHQTANHELVKDCIQDLFISLKAKQGFGQVMSIKPYLFKSLRREIVRSLTKESRYSLTNEDKSFNQFDITLSVVDKMIEYQLTEQRKKSLLLAIEKLTLKQKEAIIYYFYEGFTYEEISQIMDMASVKSARKLVYRAIDSLRLSLGDKDTMLFLSLLI